MIGRLCYTSVPALKISIKHTILTSGNCVTIYVILSNLFWMNWLLYYCRYIFSDWISFSSALFIYFIFIFWLRWFIPNSKTFFTCFARFQHFFRLFLYFFILRGGGAITHLRFFFTYFVPLCMCFENEIFVQCPFFFFLLSVPSVCHD